MDESRHAAHHRRTCERLEPKCREGDRDVGQEDEAREAFEVLEYPDLLQRFRSAQVQVRRVEPTEAWARQAPQDARRPAENDAAPQDPLAWVGPRATDDS